MAGVAVLSGCAGIDATVRSYGGLDAPVELAETPFFPQERYQCGPAALATVLAASNQPIDLESLTRQVYLPGRQGSLQVELLASTRGQQRIPYVIDGTLEAIIGELEASRPVLVLQNLGVNWFPQWHYAVVVGVDPVDDRIILRSGTERRRVTPTRTFLHTWRRSDFWAMTVLQPGELPAAPDRTRYLESVAAMEATGHLESAYAGWLAGLERWPADSTALFGLASAAYGLGRYVEAEGLYRELLTTQPDLHPARNNLAYTLLAQGRQADALAEIRYILDHIDDSDSRRDAYEDSYRDIAARGPQQETIR